MCSIELPELADLEGLGARELERTLRELDVARRRVDALIAETVGIAERSGAFGEDGHASVSGWVKAACNWSGGDTKAAVQSARVLHAVPATREAAHSGSLGLSQMRLLARLFANPRCADQLNDSAALLLGHAASLWFDEFAVVVRRWEALADADGAHGAHERAHTRRDAHVSIVGEHVYLDARGGVVAGAMIEEIFGRFCDAEFHADWDAGVAVHGAAMAPALLDRSDAQRRFDALLAVFSAAAASGSAGRIDPLVNVIVDQLTFEHHLATLAGADIPPLDPESVDRRRCETSTGHQLDPADMLAAAVCGHVAESCSTPPAWSSISAADQDCSPAARATRCCSEIDGVSGPDAVFAPGAARPTTPHPGQATALPGPTTVHRRAPATTDGNSAATEQRAMTMGTGTSIDLTAARSDMSPRTRWSRSDYLQPSWRLVRVFRGLRGT